MSETLESVLDATTDTLANFIGAYILPGAIIERRCTVPILENNAFAALRIPSSALLLALDAALDEGVHEIKTVVAGHAVRWTITRDPTNSNRAVFLAQVASKDDVRVGVPLAELQRDERVFSSSGRRAEAMRLEAFTPNGHPSSKLPHPGRLHLSLAAPPHPTSPLPPDRSWTHDPRFSALLEAPSETGDLLRSVDWARTALGPITSWSPVLLTMFGLVLHNHIPCCVIWGPHRALLYNALYVSFLGHDKHPHALGRPAREVWPDIWHKTGSLLERACGGEKHFYEDMQFFIPRPPQAGAPRPSNLEEAFVTWWYVPLYEVDGTVGGVYNPCYDTTTKVLSQRRMNGLRRLSKRFAAAKTVAELVVAAFKVFENLGDDIPYAAGYTVPESGPTDDPTAASSRRMTFTLCDTIGIPFGAPAAPTQILVYPDDPATPDSPAEWPIDLRSMIVHREFTLHAGLAPLLETLPQRGALPARPDHAAVLPITDGQELLGCLVLYLGAGQPLTEDMRRFLDMLAKRISVSATMVLSYQAKERKLAEMAQLRAELECRMAEQMRRLEESRESFTRLCERLPVGIHRNDPDGILTWANQKWLQTFGLPPDGLHRWAEAIHPKDIQAAGDAYMEAIRSGIGYTDPIEMQAKDHTKDGQWIDIIYDCQPEFALDGSGTIIGWVGVWFDVSHLRRFQRAAMEAERAHAAEADRNRELQEQFIDITCHELRNPLNAIYNSAIMVGESLTRVEGRIDAIRAEGAYAGLHPVCEEIRTEIREDIDSAATILQCAKHQQRITDDVLNVSKLKAGLITIDTRDFSPWDEAQNTVRMFREQAAARGLDLRLERDDSLDTLAVRMVRGDSNRFVQVIVNLISNAIKFTERAPHCEIRVRVGASAAGVDLDAWPPMEQDDLLPMCRAQAEDANATTLRLYVAVADSGVGMMQEEQDRLFQRFAQASPRTYGKFGGSGLGLYISRMLVELHGGQIHLQSKKGVGTTLRFFITVDRSAGLPPASSEAETLAPSFGRNRSYSDALDPDATSPEKGPILVLVVEDNLINQRILVKLLTSLGCATRTCNDGRECVDLFTSKAEDKPKIDLILMDVEMPVLDGLAATQEIRALEDAEHTARRVPIVAVSGNARSEWADRARAAGMDGFVRKPYGRAELEAVVNTWRERDRAA